ncbi:hypothetical protein U1Q18_034399 [Sarracenia purpurea var. burkii]
MHLTAKELIWQGIVIFGGGGKSAHFKGFLPVGDCSGKRQRVRSLPAVSGEEEASATGYFWPELQSISERSVGLPWSDRNKEETRSGFQVKHGEDDSGDPVLAVLCSTKSGSCRGRDGDFGRPAEDLVQRLKTSVHRFRRFESKEISEFLFGRTDCRRRRCRGEKSGIFAGGKFVWIRAIIQCVARVTHKRRLGASCGNQVN